MEIPRARYMPGPPLQVARLAIWYPETDQFLVAVRTDTGLIEFPGGKCDPGESLDQGAVRETREEVGLHAIPISPFASYDTRKMEARQGREEYAGRTYKGAIALAQEVGRMAHGLCYDPAEVVSSKRCTLPEIENMCQEGAARSDMNLVLPVVRRLLHAHALIGARR